MTYRNLWFDGRVSTRQLPAECVADCSSQGDCYSACQSWVDRLSFDGPAWLFREYLSGFGCWHKSELCNHEENRIRVLWVWAGCAWEDPDAYSFLYLER